MFKQFQDQTISACTTATSHFEHWPLQLCQGKWFNTQEWRGTRTGPNNLTLGGWGAPKRVGARHARAKSMSKFFFVKVHRNFYQTSKCHQRTVDPTIGDRRRRNCERLEHLFRQTGIKVEPFDLWVSLACFSPESCVAKWKLYTAAFQVQRKETKSVSPIRPYLSPRAHGSGALLKQGNPNQNGATPGDSSLATADTTSSQKEESWERRRRTVESIPNVSTTPKLFCGESESKTYVNQASSSTRQGSKYWQV